MNDQLSRKDKLRTTDHILALASGAMRTGREGRTKRPPVDAFPAAVADWKAETQEAFARAGVPDAWSLLVGGLAETQLGLELGTQMVGVLKWRLRDRVEDMLGEAGRRMTAVRAWLDVLGSGLIDHATGHGSAHYTREEDLAFASELQENMAAAVDWATAQDSGLSLVVKQQLETIEDRYNGELTYNMSAVNAWHAGWAMLTTAWLLADVVASSLPVFGHRMCRFPEAQRARLEFIQTAGIECPRCGAALEFDDDLSRTDLKLINATCESCEVVIFFPYQVLPSSIWNGPTVELAQSGDSASGGAARQDAPRESAGDEDLRMRADSRKVFIIHGRNADAAKELASFVMSLSLEPIAFGELSAQMGGTPTIADIVTRGMELAQGVIALFTGDEWAELHPALRNDLDKPADLARWQARPNVIFEAGMAFGRSRDRVVFVLLGNVDLFTDVAGIHFLRPSNSPVGDRDTLRRKLVGMGCTTNDSSAWMTAGDFEKCVVREAGTLSPFRNDIDIQVATNPGMPAVAAADRASIAAFERVADSSWMLSFRDVQLNAPQFLKRADLDVLAQYASEARKPETEFYNDGLRTAHGAFVKALNNYLTVSAAERVPVRGSDDVFVITTKANSSFGHIDDYDALYQGQVDAIRNVVNALWSTWSQYARVAKLFRMS